MEYPRYFVVDFDIYVRLEKRGDDILGFNLYDSPYPVRKAIAEGEEITKEKYDKATKPLLEQAEP